MAEISENEKKAIQNFLIRCLNPANTLDASLCREWSSEQFNYFYMICKQKRIYPIIYNRLKSVSGMPEELIDPLQKLHKENAIHNVQLFSELKKIIAAFNQHGIEPTLLKGKQNETVSKTCNNVHNTCHPCLGTFHYSCST